MSLLEVLVALVIAIGIVGIVVPVLPGSVLVLAAVLVWAVETSSATGWVVLAVAVAFLATGTVVKYVVPGRRLRSAGVPASTLWIGGALGVVGFFVVPVVGLLLGFVLGVYLAERHRVGGAAAWPATVHALKAVGLSILVEMVAACLAAMTWLVGAVLT